MFEYISDLKYKQLDLGHGHGLDHGKNIDTFSPLFLALPFSLLYSAFAQIGQTYLAFQRHLIVSVVLR